MIILDQSIEIIINVLQPGGNFYHDMCSRENDEPRLNEFINVFCFFSFLLFHFISSHSFCFNLSVLFLVKGNRRNSITVHFLLYTVRIFVSFLFLSFFLSLCSLTINLKTKDKTICFSNCNTNILLITHRSFPLNTLSFIKNISHFDHHFYHFSSEHSTDHRRTTFEHMQRDLT